MARRCSTTLILSKNEILHQKICFNAVRSYKLTTLTPCIFKQQQYEQVFFFSMGNIFFNYCIDGL